ncbi:hypothetical protein BD410DRAFT_786440 [Rickenella mellea]|uniref:HeH/LEM domain-containing protein n=1 Tax=Rickenella mellea TaxID=50990 RepID=A0A4Y7Q9R1_9AGAM|nr:hypothetical protein BD410DRAFT_786440 [Rickenella mellea]
MESKLKALKVVELREILTKANVEIPSRAHKPDLIAKIIASPKAIEIFNGSNADGASSSPGAAPSATPTVLPQNDVASVPTVAMSQLSSKDTLTPPETSLAPKAVEPRKPTSTNKTNATVPKASTIPVTPDVVEKSSLHPAAPAPTSVSGDSATANAPQEVNNVVDEQLERRRKRAERFGIPLVEPSKSVGRKTQKHSRNSSNTPGSPATPSPAATNGAKPTPSLPDDLEKIKARQERFGTNAAIPAQLAGKKRGSPAPDDEEMERRRKRAERFGLNK